MCAICINLTDFNTSFKLSKTFSSFIHKVSSVANFKRKNEYKKKPEKETTTTTSKKKKKNKNKKYEKTSYIIRKQKK